VTLFDTGGKFVTGINEDGGKFATCDVVRYRWKICHRYQRRWRQICHRCQQQSATQQHEESLATAGTPKTVATPGAEGMVPTAGPQQQQKSQWQHNSWDATTEETTTMWKHQDLNTDVTNSMTSATIAWVLKLKGRQPYQGGQQQEEKGRQQQQVAAERHTTA
jgi:hypothetical protein